MGLLREVMRLVKYERRELKYQLQSIFSSK